MPFSLRRFREQRLWRRRLGAWGFWASVVFAVLDFTTPLPLVERGAFLFVELTLMAIFAGVYYLGCKLPLEETIEIARGYNNHLKVTDVTRELNVSLTTAQRILTALVHKGLAVSTISPDEFGVTIYFFPELQATKPVPTTPAEWEAYRPAQQQEQPRLPENLPGPDRGPQPDEEPRDKQ